MCEYVIKIGTIATQFSHLCRRWPGHSCTERALSSGLIKADGGDDDLFFLFGLVFTFIRRFGGEIYCRRWRKGFGEISRWLVKVMEV